MLYGFDVSHWNGKDGVEKGIANCKKYPAFCFIKATEGKAYKDKLCDIFVSNAMAKGLQIGFYHYARPEYNTVSTEVANFMSVYNKYDKRFNIIPILDWEGIALNFGEDWALNWLTSVYELTGIKPIFYCQQSALKKYPNIAKLKYPLWVARYRRFELGVGNIEPFELCDFWQYTSNPMDMNVFYGDKEDLLKIASRRMEDNKEDDMYCNCHHCGCSCHEEE